ncbi:phage tail assembly protein T [Acinetobacter harbinensis]|uniref:phage tail assembly protein T n=1 Tax=Acinetobacter harbinensis TaxID=1353941 RepID=UPI003F8EF24E
MDLSEDEEGWCELVINGIGGRTIAEAKRRITRQEFLTWRAFRQKRGSLFLGRRIEQGFGNLMATYLGSKGAKDIKAQSFMPHEDTPEEMSLEEYMMQTFGGEELS